MTGAAADSRAAGLPAAGAVSDPDRVGRFARLAWLVLGANLAVILWGAYVRASGSGAGCGSHWPLCNGAVLPRSPALATIIELTHRATSGIALLLVLWLVVAARRAFAAGDPARRAAHAAGLFIASEALLGAGLVLLEHVADDRSIARGWWVGAHLLNTYLLVAALALAAWRAALRPVPGGTPAPANRLVLAAALAAMLLLGTSGAITALGDTLFPVATLAEGKALTFSPGAHVFVRLRVWHPAIAVLAGVLLAGAIAARLATRPGPAVRRVAAAAAALYAVQLVVGVANVWWLAPVALQIVHLLLADLCWVALVLLAAGEPAPGGVAAPAPRIAAA